MTTTDTISTTINNSSDSSGTAATQRDTQEQ
jgi:hypothetical protein